MESGPEAGTRGGVAQGAVPVSGHCGTPRIDADVSEGNRCGPSTRQLSNAGRCCARAENRVTACAQHVCERGARMAQFLAVSNRKGGVGKSTIAVMLAHAAAAWSRQRVLVMDLDTQCNASLMLVGGVGWERANRERAHHRRLFLRPLRQGGRGRVRLRGQRCRRRRARAHGAGPRLPAAGLAASRGPAGRAAAQALQEGPARPMRSRCRCAAA